MLCLPIPDATFTYQRRRHGQCRKDLRNRKRGKDGIARNGELVERDTTPLALERRRYSSFIQVSTVRVLLHPQ